MSLVIGVVCEKFILFCWDCKIKYSNGTISNNFRKVFKPSPTIIIGMTGTMEGNYTLLQPIINPDFTISDKIVPNTYNDFINSLNSRLHIINENKNKVAYFYTAIGGWNGHSFCINTYSFDGNKDIHEHNKYTPLNTNETRFVYLQSPNITENQNHKNNFMQQITNGQEYTMLYFKNMFKSTVEKGMNFDDSINDNVIFESIRYNDILKM